MAGKPEAATPKVFVCASAWLGVGKKRGAEGKTREGGGNRKSKKQDHKTRLKHSQQVTHNI